MGRFVLHFLFHLASLGYSGEQIIDGILFGEITALQAPPPATLHCWGLTEFASDGSLLAITPALPPAENSSDQCKAVAREFEKGTNADLEAWTPDSKNWFKVGTTTKTVTVPEDDPLPWTFAGTGTVAVTVATVNELTYSNVWEFSITLFDDGTLEYTHRLPAGRAGYGHNCPGGDLYQDTFARAAEVTRQGTHADGTLSIPITYADDRKAVQEGTYTQEAIRLDDLSAPYDLGCEDLVISMVTEFPFDIPRTEP